MHQIHEGQMLMRTKAILPEQLRLRGTSLTPGWLILDEDSGPFSEHIRAAEWNLFWVPQQSSGWSVAVDKQDALEGALCRAVNQIRPRYNAVEITRVKVKRILGMYFCQLEVSGRHVQKGAIWGMIETADQVSSAEVLTGIVGGGWKRNGKSAA